MTSIIVRNRTQNGARTYSFIARRGQRISVSLVREAVPMDIFFDDPLGAAFGTLVPGKARLLRHTSRYNLTVSTKRDYAKRFFIDPSPEPAFPFQFRLTIQ